MKQPVWITEAVYKRDFQIFLKFSDGTEGDVNLETELTDPIFELLRDKQFFKNFQLNSWTIEWPNGADFAPEFLYKQIMKHQRVS